MGEDRGREGSSRDEGGHCIEKNETLEEAASKRKEEAIDKHNTNKQELEPQERLPGGKNQSRPSPVQGTKLKDGNRTREQPDKMKTEPVEFTYRPKLEQVNRTWGFLSKAKGGLAKQGV